MPDPARQAAVVAKKPARGNGLMSETGERIDRAANGTLGVLAGLSAIGILAMQIMVPSLVAIQKDLATSAVPWRYTR